MIRFLRHNGAAYVCMSCMARTTGLLTYMDMSAQAPFRRTAVTHRTYLRNTEPTQLSPWSGVRDFVIELHRDCSQHILFQEGVASFVVGSTLKCLITEGHFGVGDVDTRIEAAYIAFQNSPVGRAESHKAAPWTQRKLGFVEHRCPRVSASYKHGQIRAFLTFAALQANQAWSVNGSLRQELQCTCVSSLAAFVKLLDGCGCILSEAERQRAFEHGVRFRESYSILLFATLAAGDYLCGCTAKVHQLDHQISHLEFSCLNPLFQWACWGEATFMGVTAKTTKAVHPSLAGLKRALQRYILWLHCEFDGVSQGGWHTNGAL